MTGRETIGLLVAGAHRSGNSALARVLNLHGAFLPGESVPATNGLHEKGTWEPPEFVAINDRVLAAAGLTGHSVKPFPDAWLQSPAADRLGIDARSFLSRNFTGRSLFVVKDPRICRFLPFWLDGFTTSGIEPAVVIPIRHPLEVADSLQARAGLPRGPALLLWLRQVLEAERHSRSARRAFVSYADLLTDWAPCIDGIRRRLEIVWPVDADAAGLAVEDFLSPDLKHHEHDEGVLAQPGVSPLIGRVFHALSALCDDPSDSGSIEVLNDARAQLAEADLLFASTLDHARESERATSERMLERAKRKGNRLARKLRRECLRLSREASGSRREIENLHSIVQIVMGTWTWRVAIRLNRIAARLLRIRGGPPAWEHLVASLGGKYETNAELLSAPVGERDVQPSVHAGPATDGAGLARAVGGETLLGQSRACGWENRVCLVDPDQTDATMVVPGWRIDRVRRVSEADLDAADAVVAVVGPRTDWARVEAVLEAADRASLSSGIVAAAADLHRPGQTSAAFDLTATFGRPGESGPFQWGPLNWSRFLNELCLLGTDRDRRLPFVAAAYLAENPDVARAIARGEFRDAQDHWLLLGREEFIRGYRSFRRRAQPVSMGLREATPELRRLAATEIESWSRRPVISVLVPIHRVEVRWLRAAVESVVNQLYAAWELCLVDDGSRDDAIREYLESLDDPRIKVKALSENRGIAGASNAALELASGDYLALLDHDDELTLDALWLVARVIRDFDPDLIYSDEAKLDLAGQVVEPHFKPDFSPEMILSQNYISHLGVYRRALVQAVGGFREGYQGSQDHDLLVRFLARASTVFHLPRILYYWRKVPGSTASRFGDKDYAWDSGVRALQDLERARGSAARVERGSFPGTYRVRHPIAGNPKVSILIPFRDKPELLDQCLESVLEKTEHSNFEIIGIDNRSRKAATAAAKKRWQRQDARVRFIEFDAPFNFSALNNLAALEAHGEHLLLLNNDITVIEPGWLGALLEFSQQPRIGAVGGLLLYPDRTVQHAGVIVGIGGVAGHSHKYLPADHHGYFCRPHLIQNLSAVTGACLMVKRELYLALGGLEEDHLTIAFNDIDFCLRLRERGFRNVYTPYCRLIHHESKSRGPEDTPEKQRRFAKEVRYMRNRHGLILSTGDPYYNPNLTVVREDFSVRKS